jgi:hypothetical protein
VSSGDHLFVERLTIHFRKLKRGDVIVFNTENISSPTQELGGYYYIKRLVGLPATRSRSRTTGDDKAKGESEFKCADELSDKFKRYILSKADIRDTRLTAYSPTGVS